MQDSRASGQTGAMELLFALEQMCEWADEYMRHDKAPTYDMPFEARMVIKKFRALRAVLPALSPPAIGDGEMIKMLGEELVREKWDDTMLGNPVDMARHYKAILAFGRRIAERAGASDRQHTDRSIPCPTCGFRERKIPRQNFVFETDEPALHTDEKKGG